MFWILIAVVSFGFFKVAQYFLNKYDRMNDLTTIANFVGEYHRTSRAITTLSFITSVVSAWFSIVTLAFWLAVPIAIGTMAIMAAFLVMLVILVFSKVVDILFEPWEFSSYKTRLSEGLESVSKDMILSILLNGISVLWVISASVIVVKVFLLDATL